ncbi:MAG: hypothetical protein ACP5IL_11470 [Syntrophobacteraceae bacterium]
MRVLALYRTIFLSPLFCFSILLALPFTAAAQNGALKVQEKDRPSIQIRNPEFNFGTSFQGHTVEHVFTVENTGGKVLKIEHVKVA